MTLTKVLNGHVIEVAKGLPANWFHSILTSPPYWQLRDYKTPHQQWPAMGYVPISGFKPVKVKAWTGELGQEPTIDMFIAHLVYVFRELKRVLRDDGTLWVNLGDSYIGNGSNSDTYTTGLEGRVNSATQPSRATKKDNTIAAKNKCGIPHRFALAMQADGWIWRDDIIWHKRSPMPGSQRDRTSVAHEMVMMFSKKRHYFYDIHSILEKSSDNTHNRGKGITPKSSLAEKGTKNNNSFAESVKHKVDKRYPRSVWTLSSEPSKELHFATWPTKLVRKMVLASTSEKGCCSKCGKPWFKILKRKRFATRSGAGSKVKKIGGWAYGKGSHDVKQHNTPESRLGRGLHPDSPYQDHHGTICGNRDPQRHTTKLVMKGWQKPCECEADIVPCRVLDPFGGMATTGLVCERLHRECTAIELSPAYASRAESRLEQIRQEEVGMFYRSQQ